MTTLITDSKDERLVVRVYRNAPEGLVRAMEDINVLAARAVSKYVKGGK